MRRMFECGLRGVAVCAIFVFATCGYAQEQRVAAFTAPHRGDTIENREEFAVTVEIDDAKPGTHYWVAIASVTGNDNTWPQVLELYKKMNSGTPDKETRSEMVRLVSGWNLDQFWPKYFVPKAPYTGKVFDGGKNPLSGLEPQPMVLLILKVDDKLQEYFKTWFKDGSRGKGYPGIPASKLGKNMIVARCEIFFP